MHNLFHLNNTLQKENLRKRQFNAENAENGLNELAKLAQCFFAIPASASYIESYFSMCGLRHKKIEGTWVID
jgi:hypothetical protein